MSDKPEFPNASIPHRPPTPEMVPVYLAMAGAALFAHPNFYTRSELVAMTPGPICEALKLWFQQQRPQHAPFRVESVPV